MADRDPVLIEQKKNRQKAMRTGGLACMALGFIALFTASITVGLFLICAGACYALAGSSLAWWRAD